MARVHVRRTLRKGPVGDADVRLYAVVRVPARVHPAERERLERAAPPAPEARVPGGRWTFVGAIRGCSLTGPSASSRSHLLQNNLFDMM